MLVCFTCSGCGATFPSGRQTLQILELLLVVDWRFHVLHAIAGCCLYKNRQKRRVGPPTSNVSERVMLLLLLLVLPLTPTPTSTPGNRRPFVALSSVSVIIVRSRLKLALAGLDNPRSIVLARLVYQQALDPPDWCIRKH